MAARSLAARALRTAFEALVFGDFIMAVLRQPLAWVGVLWGLNSAVARSVRLLGASVRICPSDAALRQPNYAHSGAAAAALGWVCRSSGFSSTTCLGLLREVWEASLFV